MYAGDSIGLRRVDEDHQITQFIPSRLQQHRGDLHAARLQRHERERPRVVGGGRDDDQRRVASEAPRLLQQQARERLMPRFGIQYAPSPLDWAKAFGREAPRILAGEGAEQPLGELLEQGRYGKAFIDHYIVPMGAAIWSTDAATMQSFPAKFFIRFLLNHGMLSVNDRPVWRTVSGGSARYVARLLE